MGTTSITFINDLPPGNFVGAQVRIAQPGAGTNRLLFTTVTGTAGSPTNTLLVADPTGAIYSTLGLGAGFTVLPDLKRGQT